MTHSENTSKDVQGNFIYTRDIQQITRDHSCHKHRTLNKI